MRARGGVCGACQLLLEVHVTAPARHRSCALCMGGCKGPYFLLLVRHCMWDCQGCIRNPEVRGLHGVRFGVRASCVRAACELPQGACETWKLYSVVERLQGAYFGKQIPSELSLHLGCQDI